jgi:hypothetical protein
MRHKSRGRPTWALGVAVFCVLGWMGSQAIGLSGSSKREPSDDPPLSQKASEKPASPTKTPPPQPDGLPRAEILTLPQKLAWDLSDFVREYLGDQARVRVLSVSNSPESEPLARLEVVAPPKFTKTFRGFVDLFQRPNGAALSVRSEMEAYLRATGRVPGLKQQPRPESSIYHLSPKRARAVASLIQRYGRVPISAKAKLGVLTVTTTPAYHGLLKAMLEQLGLEKPD